MTNPLLENLRLPAFSRINPEHVEPAIDRLIDEHRALVRGLLEKREDHTWESLMQPLEDKDDQLHRAWSPVSHLHSVADNEALRRAYNACLPKLTDHATELGQNQDLYRACKTIAGSDEFSQLDISQQKIIENALRDFRLSGIELGPQEKNKYKTLQQRLSSCKRSLKKTCLMQPTGGQNRSLMRRCWGGCRRRSLNWRLRMHDNMSKKAGCSHWNFHRITR